MKILTTIPDLKKEIFTFKKNQLKIGFVPTMGALHEGHLSLVRESENENDVTVVSIFVNPTQFNAKKDFQNYPITLGEDERLLRLEGVGLLFLPTENDLYADNYNYRVIENNLSKILCGAHRPGHFEGVLTVVLKLLNIVEANRAYFGEKDYQQLQLIKGMVNAFFISTEIVSVPTVREADGLAMSSRNRRLSDSERKQALEFTQILKEEGLSLNKRKEQLKEKGFEVDYIEESMGRRLGAVKLGDIRLIDNVELKGETPNTI